VLGEIDFLSKIFDGFKPCVRTTYFNIDMFRFESSQEWKRVQWANFSKTYSKRRASNEKTGTVFQYGYNSLFV